MLDAAAMQNQALNCVAKFLKCAISASFAPLWRCDRWKIPWKSRNFPFQTHSGRLCDDAFIYVRGLVKFAGAWGVNSAGFSLPAIDRSICLSPRPRRCLNFFGIFCAWWPSHFPFLRLAYVQMLQGELQSQGNQLVARPPRFFRRFIQGLQHIPRYPHRYHGGRGRIFPWGYLKFWSVFPCQFSITTFASKCNTDV